MQEMFDNAKRVANSAVERAAWEAEKLRRAAAIQREIELTQRERTTLLEQLAALALDLERQGQLPAGPLRALAERLRDLTDAIAKEQSKLQAVRDEPFTPGSVSISFTRRASSDETEACPACHRPVRKDAAYCSGCGAKLR